MQCAHNALLAGERRRRRQEKDMDYVLAEYKSIAATEAKDAACSSDSPFRLALEARAAPQNLCKILR